MNKEQQIEEMANIIKAEYEQWLDTTGVIPKATTYYAECLGCAIDSAKALYNAGYLKGETISCQVTVDSSLLDHINQLADRLVEIRNETAKEFAEKLKERCHNYYPSIDHYCCSVKAVSVKDINELLKEYDK